MIGVLVDTTRCTGCNTCVEACVQANALGPEPARPTAPGDGLSARRWTAIVRSPEGRPVRKFCRHCLEPACVSVCPVGAMQRTSEGAVIYDRNKCIGCRYCLMACPYGIPRYEWESTAPLVRKCQLCSTRLGQGQPPACVEACPEGALIYGERQELLQLAQTRLAHNPGRYQPIVYGAQEAGGSAVMYLSDVPLDFLSVYGQPGESPLPELTWRWLSKVPGISVATAGLMTGLFVVIGRRMQAEEARARRAGGSS